MSSDELEAKADKHAFPWQCINCARTFHYPRRQTGLGDVCEDCWQMAKRKLFDESERVWKSNVFVKLLPLTLLGLLLTPISAFACVQDEDDSDDFMQTIFGSPAREREREECQDNGLKPGSYFDSKGRIVGSPCNPEEYCADRGSTDVAVIDYCGDTWDEQPIEQGNDSKDFCKENPTFPTCYEDAFPPADDEKPPYIIDNPVECEADIPGCEKEPEPTPDLPEQPAIDEDLDEDVEKALEESGGKDSK